ncbi:hypothetical protein [Flavobacterium sp. GP15]|uniref:hypothetical protein n=1 Tax=Flavobacterium sp. GP15 TaxID=2758567 RepID=UPI00165D566C|nr:hypothetical protein [Flavobacterium sp. GP15]
MYKLTVVDSCGSSLLLLLLKLYFSIINANSFNEKWKNNLIDGGYGLDIANREVSEYLNHEFEKEKIENPNFKYFQIKIKFGSCRVYTNNYRKKEEWEKEIERIMKLG